MVNDDRTGAVTMYVRDVGESLLRRWYFSVLSLFLVTGLAVLTAALISPTYQAKASLVLVPPETTTGSSGNPYLFLGGLQQSVDVLTRAISADNIRAEVAKKAPTGSYEVVADFGTSAPILLVTALDTTGSGAKAMLAAVETQVPVTLRDLQRSLGVRTGAQITSMTVTSDDKAQAIQKKRLRGVVLISVVSASLLFMFIGFLDGVLLLRSASRDEAEDEAEDDDISPLDELTELERQLETSPSTLRKRS